MSHSLRMLAKIVAFGGYDEGKPRVRLLLDALQRSGALSGELKISVWGGMEDKSVAGRGRIVVAILRLFLSLPAALWRLARWPRDHAVLLPYPGTPEIFPVALLAWFQRRTVILDAFLPIHDTIVRDRGLVRDGRVLSRIIKAYEAAGLRLADLILVDTDQHGEYFAREFGLDGARMVTVLVGAEPLFDSTRAADNVDDLIGPPDDRRIVLFYGQLIPLHGIETILHAARLTQGETLHWVIVGKGQQEPLVREFLASGGSEGITWIPWVDYERLPSLIARAGLCLGIFGSSDKAARVIPNKLFQALAMGKPVVTRSSPAVDTLARRFPETILTVPPENAAALAEAVLNAVAGQNSLKPLSAGNIANLGPDQGVRDLIARLGSL
ncbi:MAG: hypothetical protein C0510_07375 [Erythrobacter sp.]|nr:hypothetical protein [Erythrobacter sp.]